MVETALTTLMLTVSVMTKIRVGKYDSCGVCNGPGAIYSVDVRIFLKETVIVMGTY